MPHGHCYMWQPEILWLHVVSDTLIALSYYSIPFALLVLIKRRKDLAFGKVFLLFGIFILLCGTTHILAIWTVWHGTYRLTGIVKMLTSIFSVLTAVVIWPIIPKVLEIPSNKQLSDVNEKLSEEVMMRKEAEDELLQHQNKLEELVDLRTGELERINQQLRKEIQRREHYEKKIRESEERYQDMYYKYHDLYEHAPDMYVTVEPVSGRILDCNQTTADELGFTKGALLGEPLFNYCTPVSLESASNAFRTLKHNGIVKNAELQLQRKDGSFLDVMLKAVDAYNPDGERIASHASLRDVTALNVAREAVRESVARITAIVDHAVDAILTIDDKGTIESFNPAAERIFGYEANEIIGQNVRRLMPEPYQREHDQYLSNYRETRDKKIIGIGREVKGLRKDGVTFPIELSVSELEVNGEHLYTGIIRDITERKRLEQIKDEFVSIVSHELRTPLTSINGSLGLIASGMSGDLPEMISEMVTIAKRNCERLIRLVNDLLDMQKMESGMFEIVCEKVDLIQLISRAREGLAGFSEEHEVQLVLDADVEAFWIEADADRILQVLVNLLSNAIKFSPSQGRVRIQVITSQDSVRVNVIDNGEGIPDEVRDRIFEKFMQADSSIKRSKGGTGLGLNISRRIITMHSGTIDFESTPGEGTVFYFILPVTQDAPILEELTETAGHDQR